MDLDDHRLRQTFEEFDWLVSSGETPERAAKRLGLRLDSLLDMQRRRARKKEVA